MFRPRIRIAAVCATLLLAAHPAAAQDDQPPQGQEPPTPETVTVDYRYAGGKLSDYLDGLRANARAKGIELNVVVPRDTVDFDVPPMTLTDVSIETALYTLEPTAPTGVRVDIKNVRKMRDSQTVYVVMTRELDERQRVSQQPVYATFSLRGITTHPFGLPEDVAGLTIPAEDVLNAIQLGLKLVHSDAEPELLYHAESGLLFLRGTNAQREMANDVLIRLESDVESRRRSVAARLQAPSPPAKDAARSSPRTEAPAADDDSKEKPGIRTPTKER